MTKRSKLLGLVLPALGLSTIVYGWTLILRDRPVRPAEEPPRPPSTAPAQAANSTTTFIGAIGLTEPRGEAIAIAPHIAGVVSEVLVQLGQTVKAGEPLLRIDARTAERTLASAAARLAVAEADVDSLRAEIPPQEAELAAAEAAIGSAEAAIRTAEAELADRQNQERIAMAVGDARAISSEELERRRFAVQAATARRDEATSRRTEAAAALLRRRALLSQLRAPDGQDGPRLLAARARVAEAKAEHEAAATELERHTVRAPADAKVIQVNVRAGEFAPAMALSPGLLMLGREPLVVRAQLDEVDIARFDPKAPAYASPRGHAARRIPLRVLEIEPLVVPKTVLSGRASELIDTRVLEVVFTLTEPADDLSLGMQLDLYIEAKPLSAPRQ